jgi:hypothetical protein
MISLLLCLGAFVALLAFINHFGTPRYCVVLGPRNREAFCLFLGDTISDMWKLMLQANALPAKQAYLFSSRLAFFTDLKDRLERADKRCNSSLERAQASALETANAVALAQDSAHQIRGSS